MADVLVPERLLKKMERVLDRLDKQEELINEDEAAKYLGVSKRTLQNQVSKGEIKRDCYKIAITNRRMYIKSKLILPVLIACVLLGSCGVDRYGTCPTVNNRFFYKNH